MQLDQLKQLKKVYLPYSPFWNQWVEYKHNGLSETDIYIINILKERDFRGRAEDLLMFYFKEKIIIKITEKLEKNYPEFQNWVIIKFQLTLLNLNTFKGDNPQEETPLSYLKNEKLLKLNDFFNTNIYSLPLNNKLKNILLRFKIKILNNIIENYSDTDFKKKNVFKNVMDFQAAFEKSEQGHPQRAYCNHLI